MVLLRARKEKDHYYFKANVFGRIQLLKKKLTRFLFCQHFTLVTSSTNVNVITSSSARVDPFVFNMVRFSHFLIFTSQIVIDDCTKVMREFVRENKTFDFVINDLTDIVIQSDEQDGKS